MRPGIDPPLSDHLLLLCEIDEEEEEERGQRSYVGLVKNWEWVEWWFYKPSSLVLPLCAARVHSYYFFSRSFILLLLCTSFIIHLFRPP